MSKPKFKFSIVVPVYRNEASLSEKIQRLSGLKKNDFELELIFVDDGSDDRSYQILIEECVASTLSYKIVKLTKNFGQIQAIRAGLHHSTGDCVGIISADLQDPEVLFHEMLEAWGAGSKFVFAERKGRDEKGLGAILANLYWNMVRKFALKDYPAGGFDFCLIDRQLVNDLNSIHEKNTQIFPLIFSLGYGYKAIPYFRGPRGGGKSQWTFWKKIKLFIDTFIAFSYMPIRTVSAIGGVSALFSGIYSLWILFVFLAWDNRVTGWTTIVLLVTFFGGITLLSLGIIGEYLWRILDQVRKRPLFVVESVKCNDYLAAESRAKEIEGT